MNMQRSHALVTVVRYLSKGGLKNDDSNGNDDISACRTCNTLICAPRTNQIHEIWNAVELLFFFLAKAPYCLSPPNKKKSAKTIKNVGAQQDTVKESQDSLGIS